MKQALGIIGHAAHQVLQSAAQASQHAADPQHAARVAAAHAATQAQRIIKAEAEESEGADNLVAGAAVSLDCIPL